MEIALPLKNCLNKPAGLAAMLKPPRFFCMRFSFCRDTAGLNNFFMFFFCSTVTPTGADRAGWAGGLVAGLVAVWALLSCSVKGVAFDVLDALAIFFAVVESSIASSCNTPSLSKSSECFSSNSSPDLLALSALLVLLGLLILLGLLVLVDFAGFVSAWAALFRFLGASSLLLSEAGSVIAEVNAFKEEEAAEETGNTGLRAFSLRDASFSTWASSSFVDLPFLVVKLTGSSKTTSSSLSSSIICDSFDFWLLTCFCTCFFACFSVCSWVLS
mmetsp:Transcript_7518/g.14233  ORF Transcript_7518/g.14233 Transcript_7518/m.14233 type:complete len:272 (-) Transcript_7518:529-1344(-)